MDGRSSLFHFELDMPEFKSKGRGFFRDERFAELSRQMENDRSNYREQVLAVGWGGSPRDVKIYSVDTYGVYSHAYDGIAAIGSGQEVAMSTLLVLEQKRHFSLEETLYTVAAAKFAAEQCDGVGQKSTVMRVAWKRSDKDDPAKPPGKFIQEDGIKQLRQMWEKYGKPRIPRKAEPTLIKLADQICGSPRQMEGRAFAMRIRNAKPKRSAPETSEPGQ
jgi:hypothetical protein